MPDAKCLKSPKFQDIRAVAGVTLSRKSSKICSELNRFFFSPEYYEALYKFLMKAVLLFRVRGMMVFSEFLLF
jgi:hypothetical protein